LNNAVCGFTESAYRYPITTSSQYGACDDIYMRRRCVVLEDDGADNGRVCYEQSGTPEQPGRWPGKNLCTGALLRPWHGAGAAGTVFSYTRAHLPSL